MKKTIALWLAAMSLSASAQENVTVKTGTYGGDWASLSQWECPEWFKDAKFGIWAHWGPPLGVSIYASHAWTWLEPSQKFDGNLTKADGAGKWWEGLDPQELYAQNHAHSTGWESSGTIRPGKGVNIINGKLLISK